MLSFGSILDGKTELGTLFSREGVLAQPLDRLGVIASGTLRTA